MGRIASHAINGTHQSSEGLPLTLVGRNTSKEVSMNKKSLDIAIFAFMALTVIIMVVVHASGGDIDSVSENEDTQGLAVKPAQDKPVVISPYRVKMFPATGEETVIHKKWTKTSYKDDFNGDVCSIECHGEESLNSPTALANVFSLYVVSSYKNNSAVSNIAISSSAFKADKTSRVLFKFDDEDPYSIDVINASSDLRFMHFGGDHCQDICKSMLKYKKLLIRTRVKDGPSFVTVDIAFSLDGIKDLIEN